MNALEAPPALGTWQAALRLKRLQHLASSLGVDGLLAVPGLDGRYSIGSAQLVAHMLLGVSNRDAADACTLPDAMADSVLLITPAGISAYVPTLAAAAQLHELLGETTPCMHVFRPTAAEAADPDAAEECKLGSFVQMLRGCRSLGVPWAAWAAKPDAPNPMELESWPLLQAYGLEGVGRSGFFTQNFKVVDVCSQLQQQVYGQLDGHATEHLTAVAALTLQQHWFEMIKALGNKSVAVADLNERQVAESLLSYFSYGMLRPAHGVSQTVLMPPKLLAGARTNSLDDAAPLDPVALRAAPGPAPGLPALHLVAEAADARSPLRVSRTYFLSQGVLTHNHFADAEQEREEGYSFAEATQGWSGDDAVTLMRVYAAVVAAAKAGMQHFATEERATAESAKAAALDTLVQQCNLLGVLQPSLAKQARFALWECDHVNNVGAAAVRGSRKLKVLKLSVRDIPSKSSDHAGAILGAVSYADTFLEVPAFDSKPAQLLNLTERLPAVVACSALGAEHTVARRAALSFARLATATPESAAALSVQGSAAAVASERARRRHQGQSKERRAEAEKRRALRAAQRAQRVAVANGQAEGDGEEQAEEEGEEEEGEENEDADWALGEDGNGVGLPQGVEGWGLLGPMLTLGGGEQAVLLTGAPACPAVHGSLWCFAAGLAFVASGTGALWVLPFRGQLEAITVSELRPPAGAAPGLAAVGEVVVLRGRDAACGLPPACHLTTNRHLALPLAGLTQVGRRHVRSVVLPAWQQTCRDSGLAAEGPGAAADAAPASTISYLKDPTADSPFAVQQYGAMLAAVQDGDVGEARRRWPAMVLQDDDVEEAVARLDRLELAGGLAPLDDDVEALLLQQGGAKGVAVTLVLGLPGSEQGAVAAALAAGGGVAVALLPGDGGVAVSQADVDAALAAVVNHKRAVLCCSCIDGVAPLLRRLAASAAVRGGAAHLASVVACVGAEPAADDAARGAWVAAAMTQVAQGYVDAVVLAPGGAPEPLVKALQAELQRRLPPGVLLLARPGRAALARARDELLGLPAAERMQRLRDAAPARRWGACAPGPTPAPPPQLLSGPLQAVCLTFTGELHEPLLRETLQRLGLPAADPAASEPLPLLDPAAATARPVQRLISAYGMVCRPAQAGAEKVAVLELHASRLAALRSHESPLHGHVAVAYGAPAALAPGARPGGELLLLGSALDAAALRTTLERCCAVAAAAAAAAAAHPCRSVESVTPAERARIAEMHKFDPLPEGCCFDGSVYRDGFGDALPGHPYMDRFVAEFVGAENTAAAAAAAVGQQGERLVVTRVQQW